MDILTNENRSSWKKFTESIQAPFQYTLEWKDVVERTYPNCVPKYYMDKSSDNVKSVFPCFFVESKLFGNRIVSLPFTDFGGPIGEFSSEFLQDIISDLKSDYGNSKYIEIRLNESLPNYGPLSVILSEFGFEKSSGRQQYILDLKEESIESLWKKFEHNTRKGIKKAEKSRLTLSEISKEEDLDDFYDFYSRNMRDFGTPQHSKKFFSNLLNCSADNFKGLKCYKDDILISFLIVFHTEKQVYAAYNLSDRNYLKYQPNDLLYWEMIKWSLSQGKESFDFGQVEAGAEEGSHAHGIFRFKKKWLGQLYERPYFYLYLTPHQGSDKMSDRKKDYEKAIALWKKTPVSMTKIVGPKLCSQMGL